MGILVSQNILKVTLVGCVLACAVTGMANSIYVKGNGRGADSLADIYIHYPSGSNNKPQSPPPPPPEGRAKTVYELMVGKLRSA